LEAILKESNMKALDNPFREGIALDFAPACNPDDRSLAGSIVIEKITTTPPRVGHSNHHFPDHPRCGHRSKNPSALVRL
jgi:hypothetical protein